MAVIRSDWVLLAEYKEAAERLGDDDVIFQEIQRGEKGPWSTLIHTGPILSKLPQVSRQEHRSLDTYLRV